MMKIFKIIVILMMFEEIKCAKIKRNQRNFLVRIFKIIKCILLINYPSQIEVYKSSTELTSYSNKKALENCKEALKYEKWNCPTNSFYNKLTSNLIDREQAFVIALSTASYYHSMAINCKRQKCNYDQNQLIDLLTSTNHVNMSRDAQSYANFHNSRAGKLVS